MLLGLWFATEVAIDKAASKDFPSSTFSSIKPISRALSGLICSPVKIILLAQPSPTNLGST